MEAYAVIETGGKQLRVQAGDEIKVEKLDAEVGATITLDSVLAISDGDALTIGTPTVAGCVVTARVKDQIRDRKVINFKKKRRKGYSRKVGHRQSRTVLTIERLG